MAKSPIEGAKRTDMYRVPTESLVLVKDKKHHLYDPRNELALDEGLVLNIMTYGVLEPLLVDRESQIIDGRQRYKALVEANKRLKKEGSDPLMAPVIIKRGDEGTLFGISQSTFIRQGESITEKAQKVARFLNMGNSEEDAAIAFGVSKTAIQQWMIVLEAPKELREAADAGIVSETVVVELAKLPGKEAKAALKEMLDSGETTVRAAKAAKARAPSAKANAKASKSKGKKEVEVSTNPSIKKRKIQSFVIYANRLQKDEGAATAAMEEGLAAHIEKGGTYLDLFMLGMRVACGDRSPSSVKGFNDLMEEATEK